MRLQFHLEDVIYISLVTENLQHGKPTVINDTDFNMVEMAMERWLNAINDTATNTGLTNVADYTADLIVEQLDRDDTVLKSYILRSCFPQGTGAIALSYETANAIEEFTVTWRYTHFEASVTLIVLLNSRNRIGVIMLNFSVSLSL